jgi:hypothetical protein
MSRKEKLIERFKRQPKDFTFDELVALFGIFGFRIDHKGKTSGSRVIFEKSELTYDLHKPHPSNIIKEYQMKRIFSFFVDNNFMSDN